MKPVEGLKRASALPGPPTPRQRATTGSDRVSPLHPRERKTGEASLKKRISDTAETTRVLSISLPLSISGQFREYARHQGTQVDVLLDAIEANVDQLEELVTASRQQPPHEERSGLFDRVPPRPNHDEPFVSVSLRMKSTNVETLDELATQSGADSRSHLCAVALEAYLANS